MYFTHVVFTVVYFLIINNYFVKTIQVRPERSTNAKQLINVRVSPTVRSDTPVKRDNDQEDQDDDDDDDNERNQEEDLTPEDKHTFVALIEIVFVDSTKRICTGTIIHANVIITAGHCFVNRHNEFLTPELTTSFVVLGTSHMYEIGDEEYLPIERVVTHPNFKGWTADLALVFTFAEMTGDKHGRIIPLAGAKSFSTVDSNVTVLSWGHCKEEDTPATSAPNTDQLAYRVTTPRLKSDFVLAKSKEMLDPEVDYNIAKTPTFPQQRARDDGTFVEKPRRKKKGKDRSRYLTSSEERPRRIDALFKRSGNDADNVTLSERRNYDPSRFTTQTIVAPYPGTPEPNRRVLIHNYKVYKNWRRQQAKKDVDYHQPKSYLTIEVFGFVNVAQCRKIVSRTMPSIYAISTKNGNEILCYASEDRYITMEDSGAPAMQNGYLVAVTVGGVETDGDHIAVGMKMSCFCPWIAENLPNHGGENMTCCKNCCDAKKETNNKYVYRRGKASTRRRHKRYKLTEHTGEVGDSSSASESEAKVPKRKHNKGK